MRIIKNIFLTFILLVLLALCGITIFISKLDLNKYKDFIAEMVYKQTGRKLVFKGDIKAKFSLKPTLRIDGAYLENAKWANHKNMVEFDLIEIELSLVPLLDREISIKKIEINSPKIYLEENSRGENNWTFAKNAPLKPDEKKKKEPVAKKNDQPGENLLSTLKIDVSNVEITKAIFIYNDVDIAIDTLKLSVGDDDIKTSLKGKAYNIPFVAEGTFGGVSYFLKEMNDYPVNIAINTLDIDARIAGNIKDLNNLSGINLNVEVIASDLVNTLSTFKIDDFVSLPKVTLKTNVLGSLKNISLNNLLLRVGQSDFSGKINYKGNDITLDIKSKLIDTTEIVFIKKEGNKKPSEVKTNVAQTQASNKIFPKEKIDLSFLGKLNINAKTFVQKLVLEGFNDINETSLSVINKDGIKMKALTTMEAGKVSFDLASDKAYKNFTLNSDIEFTNFGKIYKEFEDLVMGGKVLFRTSLRTKGSSVAELMGDLNGSVTATINDAVLNFELPSIEKMIVSTVKNNKQVNALSCFVVNVDFNDGVAKLDRRIVMETSKFNMVVSSGMVDLRKEYLKAAITPKSKGYVGYTTDILSSLVKFEGPLNSPKLTIGLDGVVSLTGALLKKGKDVVIDTLNNDKSPCKTALNKGVIVQSKVNKEKTNDDIKPSSAPQSIKDVKKEFKDFGDGLIKNLKGIIK